MSAIRQVLPVSAGFGGKMPKGEPAFGAESLRARQRPRPSAENDVGLPAIIENPTMKITNLVFLSLVLVISPINLVEVL